MKRHDKKNEKGITRRSFLSGGVGTMTMLSVSPLLQGLLARQAHAEGSSGWTSNCALLHIHASGGWGFQGTFVGKDENGAPLAPSSLKFHGHSDTALSRLYTGSGTELYQDSGFTQGLLSVLSSAGQSATQIATVLNTSGDDNTSGARYGLIAGATLAGVEALVSNSAGLDNSPSGNGTFSVVQNSRAQRLYARTVGDIINAAAFSRVLGTANPTLLQAIADGIKRVSTAQMRERLGGSANETLFRTTQGENFDRLSSKITPPAGASPEEMNPASASSAARAVFGLTEKNAATIQTSTDQTELQATLIQGALTGNLGPVALRVGGYDYHGQADTTTFAKDRDLGVLVGRACELATRMGKTLMVFLTTDGGVAANQAFPFNSTPGTSTVARWQGDRRAYCGAALFTVNGPAIKRRQLGRISPTNGQVVENTEVGLDFLATAAVIANWLHLNGRIGDLDRVLAAAGLSATQVSAARSQIIF